MATFVKEESVTLQVEVRDIDSKELIDPSSVPTARLADPDGVLVIEDAEMNKKSTGVYVKKYDLPDDAAAGIWDAELEVVNSETTTIVGLKFKVDARAT